MKSAVAAFLTALVFATAAATQAQQRPPGGDYQTHLPGLNDNDWSGQTRPAAEPRIIKKGPLAPADEDRANYASFLSQPNTGLIRLLLRRHKQPDSTNADQPVKINGGGAYYSFIYLAHEYGYGSDLELSTPAPTRVGYARTDDHGPLIELPTPYFLSVGFAGADYGMLTNIGDVPLEGVTIDEPRARVMAAYEPPSLEADARDEMRRFQRGVSLNGQLYKTRLPLQLNATYVLRSIVYNRYDVWVAFRIVRQDPDASLVIAWQRLKQFARPKLIT